MVGSSLHSAKLSCALQPRHNNGRLFMFWSESEMHAQGLMGFLVAGPPNFSMLKKISSNFCVDYRCVRCVTNGNKSCDSEHLRLLLTDSKVIGMKEIPHKSMIVCLNWKSEPIVGYLEWLLAKHIKVVCLSSSRACFFGKTRIPDRLDHGASKESKNPFPERIYRFFLKRSWNNGPFSDFSKETHP